MMTQPSKDDKGRRWLVNYNKTVLLLALMITAFSSQPVVSQEHADNTIAKTYENSPELQAHLTPFSNKSSVISTNGNHVEEALLTQHGEILNSPSPTLQRKERSLRLFPVYPMLDATLGMLSYAAFAVYIIMLFTDVLQRENPLQSAVSILKRQGFPASDDNKKDEKVHFTDQSPFLHFVPAAYSDAVNAQLLPSIQKQPQSLIHQNSLKHLQQMLEKLTKPVGTTNRLQQQLEGYSSNSFLTTPKTKFGFTPSRLGYYDGVANSNKPLNLNTGGPTLFTDSSLTAWPQPSIGFKGAQSQSNFPVNPSMTDFKVKPAQSSSHMGQNSISPSKTNVLTGNIQNSNGYRNVYNVPNIYNRKGHTGGNFSSTLNHNSSSDNDQNSNFLPSTSSVFQSTAKNSQMTTQPPSTTENSQVAEHSTHFSSFTPSPLLTFLYTAKGAYEAGKTPSSQKSSSVQNTQRPTPSQSSSLVHKTNRPTTPQPSSLMRNTQKPTISPLAIKNVISALSTVSSLISATESPIGMKSTPYVKSDSFGPSKTPLLSTVNHPNHNQPFGFTLQHFPPTRQPSVSEITPLTFINNFTRLPYLSIPQKVHQTESGKPSSYNIHNSASLSQTLVEESPNNNYATDHSILTGDRRIPSQNIMSIPVNRRPLLPLPFKPLPSRHLGATSFEDKASSTDSTTIISNGNKSHRLILTDPEVFQVNRSATSKPSYSMTVLSPGESNTPQQQGNQDNLTEVVEPIVIETPRITKTIYANGTLGNYYITPQPDVYKSTQGGLKVYDQDGANVGNSDQSKLAGNVTSKTIYTFELVESGNATTVIGQVPITVAMTNAIIPYSYQDIAHFIDYNNHTTED